MRKIFKEESESGFEEKKNVCRGSVEKIIKGSLFINFGMNVKLRKAKYWNL